MTRPLGAYHVVKGHSLLNRCILRSRHRVGSVHWWPAAAFGCFRDRLGQPGPTTPPACANGICTFLSRSARDDVGRGLGDGRGFITI